MVAPDIHTRQELEGEARGAMALDRGREAASLALREQSRTDLADLSEAEFTRGLERLKLRQTRMQKILDTALVEGVHYGNPKDGRGKTAFKKPILLKAGAEELRNLLGLHLSHTEPIETIESEDYVSVKITMGVYDRAGRLLGVKSAGCNSREKRFRKFDGNGFIYKDARETVHDCLAMAEKRAGSLLTCEASGATGFFAAGDEMAAALEEEEKAITPWTAEEKKTVYAAASAKGIGRQAFAKLVMDTIGRADVGTGDEVAKLLAAMESWQPAEKAGAEEEGGA